MRALVVALLLAGCNYNPARFVGGDAGIDGQIDAPPIDAPPAVECVVSSRECVTPDTLRVCVAGQQSTDTDCPWGCLTEGTNADCGVLEPAGGAVESDDLEETGEDVTLAAGNNINSNGTISGISTGFTSELEDGVRVFRFKSLTVSGNITLSGNEPIALVANGAIAIEAIMDARGPCATMSSRTPGPGGRAGGNTGQSAAGPGAGAGNSGNADGGGGGGHGSTGGSGNSGQAGGGLFGNPTITTLSGGGGGGGGRTSTGGGGGGAVQIASNTSITIGADGGINAGGCGGGGGMGGPQDAGGGGGAGGTILLEAPTVKIAGRLAVNGGAGGDENSAGEAGRLDRTPANGDGGDGGAGNILAGGNGGVDAGGGGAVGRIRVNTRSGNVSVMGNAVMSPAFDDTPTTATKGVANVVRP